MKTRPKRNEPKEQTARQNELCVHEEYARRLRMAICYLSLFNFVWLNNVLLSIDEIIMP